MQINTSYTQLSEGNFPVFFCLKVFGTKVGKASEIVPPKKETPAHALAQLCKR